jgi:hypothetical protein
MNTLQTDKHGLNILRILLAYSLILCSCGKQMSDFENYVKKNNLSYSKYSNLVDGKCFKLDSVYFNELKINVAIIDNSKLCSGQRSGGLPNDFYIIIDRNEDIDYNGLISSFTNHITTISKSEIRKMDLNIFTNLNENEIDKTSKIILEFLKVFYAEKCKENFFPLNIFIVINADDMIYSMKKIPSYPPPN